MSSTNFSKVGRVKQLLSLRAITTGATVSQSDVDCRGGYRWALIVLDVVAHPTTSGNTTFTVEAALAAGGTYAPITDDGANMRADGVATSAVITLPFGAGSIGTYFAEIDLSQHDKFLKATFVNGAGGTSTATAFVVLFGAKETDIQAPVLQYQILTKAKATY